ncbi:hypothetical protein TRAPUB_5255 [Trametes pubescens]|uniref:Uncharacterized protein n=1 Tax=Trametes pubescens TaxID=154538 RepID=A0A1M2V8T8_TRAPU|nr:hypothetical protein TRAPUB_5255 [Trametes pubescens]
MATNNQTQAAKPAAFPDVPKDQLLKKSASVDSTGSLEDLLAEVKNKVGVATEGAIEALSEAEQSAVVLRLLQVEPSVIGSLVLKIQSVVTCNGYDGGNLFAPERWLVFGNTRLTAKADKPVAGTRVSGYDHAILGEARAFWPPPLYAVEEDGRASWCWEVDAPAAGETDQWEVASEALEALVAHVGGKTYVPFRLFNKNGCPSKRWVVRVVWEARAGEAAIGEPMDFEAPGGTKFTARKRCALCSISPPWSTYHDHAQCPYLGTLNKVRENLRYEHIRVTLGNKLEMPRTEKPVDFKAFLEEDKRWKAEMERKYGELAAALKGGKKRKVADDAPGPSKPPKTPKKEKEEKSKGKDKADVKKDVKGKGKDKSK